MLTGTALKSTSSVIIVVLAMMTSACRESPRETVIARVGRSELTLETARSHIDTSRGAISFQLREYAASWIAAELLFQESHLQGIENTPEFQRQLAELQRQLVNERYLATLIAGDTTAISEDTLEAFFRLNEKEFLVRENMFKLHCMKFSNREQAGNFGAAVVQQGSWSAAFKTLRPDSSLSTGSFMELPLRYYSQSTLYPPELWKVASSLGVSEVSFPVRTGDKYYVLQLLGSVQQGRVADYELVQDEVRQRFIIERRKKRYNELLGTLRTKYTVELLLDSATPVDSLQNSIHE